MNINSNEKILTTPILEIRNLLRKTRNHLWGIEYVESALKISREDAQTLIEELLRRDLIEYDTSFGDMKLQNTVNGNALALASAAKPVTRKTADKNFKSFMERVETINTGSYYLYKVTKIILFGSYLTDAPKVSDIDLAVELVRKEDDADRWQILREERIYEAKQEGKPFTNFLDEYSWPETEVWKFLKSRSRVLSIHSIYDSIVETTDHKVVYSA